MRNIMQTRNKKGQMIIIQLLFLFMTITVLIALIPAMKDILDIAQQSDNLNCAGFDYDNSGSTTDHALDYNSSLSTDSLSCMAIKLYVPYLLLVVLIGGISKIMYGRVMGGGQEQYVGGV